MELTRKLSIGRVNIERKWLFSLVLLSILCVFLLGVTFNIGLVSSFRQFNFIFSGNNANIFVENREIILPPPPTLPRFAYLISGSKGDLEKLWRTLLALYHPLNQYVVHLDLESPVKDRLKLRNRVENNTIFGEIGNVHVIKKANMVTYRGPTMVANTLHACAILLKKSKDWDWFINLSASDYPLITQDDLISTFTDLDRNLNFIEHTSNLGWKEASRAMPLIVDPGLYASKKQNIFKVTPRRTLPTAFKLFAGSAWTILSRPFVEYVIMGWENLPRILLMYYTNFVSSPEGYFQTVICNVDEFKHTVINHDMHYIAWDNPPKQHPHVLSINDTSNMIQSDAPFARKFKENDLVLDTIDKKLLHRENGSFTPGGWCSGELCSKVGNTNEIKPGPGAERLRRLIGKLLFSDNFRKRQCV